MSIERRRFIKLISLSGCVIVMPSSLIKSENNFGFIDESYRSEPIDLHSIDLLIYCSVYQLINKPEYLARAFNSLGYIAKQKVLLDSNKTTVADASKEVQESINSKKGFDAASINALWITLKNEEPIIEQTTLLLRVANAGIFAGLGGYAAFAIAGAPGIIVGSLLAGLSISADYVLSETAPNLLKPILEFKPSNEQIIDSYSIALKAFLSEKANTQNDLELLRQLNKNGYFPVNPDENVDTTIKKLPKTWQKIIRENITQNNAAPKSIEVIRGNLTAELKKSIDKIDKNVQDFIEEQRKEKNEMIARIQEQKDIQYNAEEIQGLGKVGSFIFALNGHEEEGRKFQGLASVAANTYEALTSKVLGPFALAGKILDAAGLLLSLFVDPKDRLLELLKPLNEKLDLLLEITYKISEQQKDIIKSLKIIYGTQLIQRAQLDEISKKLNALSSIEIENAIVLEKNDFLDSKDQLEKLFAKDISQLLINKYDLSEYATHTTRLFTYASKKSRTSTATGFQMGLDQLAITISIRTRKRCDRLTGLYEIIAAEQNIAIDKLLQINAEISSFVNPIIWAEGTKFYLESRIVGNEIKHEVESKNLKELWLDGFNLSEMIRMITKPEGINILGDKLLESYGFLKNKKFEIDLDELMNSPTLIGELFRSSNEIYRSIIKETVITSPGSYVAKKEVYGWMWFAITPDYFQTLLDKNFIALEPVAGKTEIYQIRITAEGVYKGTLLVPETIWISNDKLKFYPSTDKIYHDRQFKPFVLHEASKKLYTSIVYRSEFIKQTMDEWKNKLLPRLDTYKLLDYYGEIFRLLDTLIKWCSKETDIIQDMFLMNSIGPFSIEELSNYYTERILNNISPSGNWPFEIINMLKTEIILSTNDVKISSSLLPPNKVPPLINDVMYRLKGYMITKGIALPESSVNNTESIKTE